MQMFWLMGTHIQRMQDLCTSMYCMLKKIGDKLSVIFFNHNKIYNL